MDTPDDIAREKWYSKHAFKCGTCKYRKKNYCNNADSECCDDIVDYECSCDAYVPEKGVYL